MYTFYKKDPEVSTSTPKFADEMFGFGDRRQVEVRGGYGTCENGAQGAKVWAGELVTVTWIQSGTLHWMTCVWMNLTHHALSLKGNDSGYTISRNRRSHVHRLTSWIDAYNIA